MKNIVARMNREPGTNFLAHVVDAWINRLRDIGDAAPFERNARRHVDAWENPRVNYDRAFKRCVEMIVATSDACGGPQNDYLLRPHIVDMYATARQLLNYLEHLDGGSCDDLLRQLAQADGFNPDNVS